MFRNLLRPDSPLMLTMTNIADCIFLSMFWLLGCFPVVTAGASFAALYDASYRAFRKGEKHSWQRFWGVFRRNLKQSILPAFVLLLGSAALGRSMIFAWNAAVAGERSWMVFSAVMVASALLVGILSLIFPVLSRFENDTQTLLKNTAFLGMANLPRTLALGFLNMAAALLCLRYILPLFFLPALTALLGSLLIEPMFRPYLLSDVGEGLDPPGA